MAFGRKIELMVGGKNSESLVLSELRISFECNKTNATGDNLNTAKIKIYNASENTIQQLSQQNNHIILKAGYADELVATLFMGDIVKAERINESPNIIVQIEATESREKFMQTRCSISYQENTSLVTVAQAFIDLLGLPVNGLEKIGNDVYEHGYSFIGMASAGLQEVLNKANLSYTIQNEMLYIISPDTPTENIGLLLTETSGIISLPTQVMDKQDNSDSADKNTSNRWKFTAMLFPQLVPGAACSIQTKSLTGNMIIEEANFKGDNFDGDFNVEVIGVVQ